MLEDRLNATALVNLDLIFVGLPFVAVDQLIGVFDGGRPGVHQRPGAGQQGAVLIALALGVESISGSPAEYGYRITDDRDLAHHAQQQPMAFLGSAEPGDVSV